MESRKSSQRDDFARANILPRSSGSDAVGAQGCYASIPSSSRFSARLPNYAGGFEDLQEHTRFLLIQENFIGSMGFNRCKPSKYRRSNEISMNLFEIFSGCSALIPNCFSCSVQEEVNGAVKKTDWTQ